MTETHSGEPPASCAGPEFRRFFAGGLAALERCATAVDRLNVFPVPDGDTGTNLVATLAQAVRAAEACPSDDLSTVARQAAAAALHASRGNSGVIFAQLCAALAASFAGADRVGADAWAVAWRAAADAARRSVASPVEGTILTVARDAAAAAAHAVAAGGGLLATWHAMADTAEATVAQTPRMLAVLERANVVDAGALGLALFLRGGLNAFTGARPVDPADLMQPSAATRRAIEEADFRRYCTQFLLRGAGGDPRRLTAQFLPYGDSVDVVTLGTDEPDPCVQIHLHTDTPDAVVAYAATLGAVSQVNVDDIQDQRARFLSAVDERQQAAVVVVAAGTGMRRLFESFYGVAVVLERRGGSDRALEGLNAAVAGVAGDGVLILPNDEHLIASTQALADACQKRVAVVPTRNMPEGVAAALAFNAARSLEENARVMTQAARAVCTVSVTYTGHASSRRAVAARDGVQLAAADDLLQSAEWGVARVVEVARAAGPDAVSMITIYYGAGVSPARAEELARRLARRVAGAETEVVNGGQSDHPLWIAIEGHVDTDRH